MLVMWQDLAGDVAGSLEVNLAYAVVNVRAVVFYGRTKIHRYKISSQFSNHRTDY